MQAYATLAFGCPFEGKVDPAQVCQLPLQGCFSCALTCSAGPRPLQVQDIVAHYVAEGADVIMLADTLGVGTPDQVEELVNLALQVCAYGCQHHNQTKREKLVPIPLHTLHV